MGKIINNADILLLSADMLSIFFDMGHYEYSDAELDKELICDRLNSQTKQRNIKWGAESFVSRSNGTELSDSSFTQPESLKNITNAKLIDCDIDEFMNTDCTDKTLIKEYEIIKSYAKIPLRFTDCEIQINYMGEAGFCARCSLRDEEFSVKEYTATVRFLRNAARTVYRDTAVEAYLMYTGTLENLRAEDNSIKLLKTPYLSKEKTIADIRENAIHSITWAHFFYDDDSYNSGDWLADYEYLLQKEAGMENTLELSATKVFIGWSHAIFLSKEELPKNEQLYQHRIYTLGFSIEYCWCKYMFYSTVIKNVDMLLSDCHQILINSGRKNYNINKYKHKIDSFYYFLVHMIESFAPPTCSPEQNAVINLQKELWIIDEKKERLTNKCSSLKEITAYINENQKNK